MGKVANAGRFPSADLAAPAPVRTATGRLTSGLTVAEVLDVSALAGSRLLAGAAGCSRVVQRLNVMEVPDILPWVKPAELLLTTGYPLRDTPQALAALVSELDSRGLAGIAIKLGRYIDELPPEMLAEAERTGFPVIQLPAGVGFDDILNQVLTDILNRQAAVLARAEDVHRALVQIVLAGGGLQEVSDELVGLLGGAVLVYSADGRVLARSGDGAPADAAQGAFCSGDGRQPSTDGGYGVHPHAGTGGSHAAVPVVAGSSDLGRIVAFSPGLLDASDVHILERAATVAALVITRQLAVRAVESKYQGDFLRDLLDGRAGPAERSVAHAAALGWDLDRPVVVVVAQPDAGPGGRRTPLDLPGVQDRLAAAWSSAVRARDQRAAVVGFAQEVVVVMGAPPRADAAAVVGELVAQLRADPAAGRRSFSTGVSRVVATPLDLPQAYEQARRAANVGRQLQGAGAVADFDRLGVFRLLSLIPDSAELHGFVRETLGELATRDDPETADLRRTLETLLDTNLNVAETARRLHFHYNTLRYRISKLERMLGAFTEDPHLRLNLALALQVLRMRGI